MRPDYAGMCAVIAVTAVSLSVVIAVTGMIWHERSLTEHGANALSAAIGGLLTLIGTFGGRQT